MARHHHRPHLSQGTLAIAVIVVALKPFQRTHPHAARSAPFTNWWSISPTSSEENEVCWTTSLPLSSPLENWAEGITDVAYLMS
jgi:hypothetical protein